MQTRKEITKHIKQVRSVGTNERHEGNDEKKWHNCGDIKLKSAATVPWRTEKPFIWIQEHLQRLTVRKADLGSKIKEIMMKTV